MTPEEWAHHEFHTLHAESCPEADWLDCVEPSIDFNCACCEEWQRLYQNPQETQDM